MVESDGAAKASFESLTEAADALINSGEKDVYECKRGEALERGAKGEEGKAAKAAKVDYFGGGGGQEQQQHQLQQHQLQQQNPDEVMWEYVALDGTLNGPIPTRSMVEWRAMGWFVGEGTVKVRVWQGKKEGGGEERTGRRRLRGTTTWEGTSQTTSPTTLRTTSRTTSQMTLRTIKMTK